MVGSFASGRGKCSRLGVCFIVLVSCSVFAPLALCEVPNTDLIAAPLLEVSEGGGGPSVQSRSALRAPEYKGRDSHVFLSRAIAAADGHNPKLFARRAGAGSQLESAARRGLSGLSVSRWAETGQWQSQTTKDPTRPTLMTLSWSRTRGDTGERHHLLGSYPRRMMREIPGRYKDSARSAESVDLHQHGFVTVVFQIGAAVLSTIAVVWLCGLGDDDKEKKEGGGVGVEVEVEGDICGCIDACCE
ncbi:hypothetical protein CBR_g31828 [Chara braunii]|uniref:Transmembrane protein n=1 Tax=Chara braunii TaxID=69332 RepID=A0A388LG43_CHABU|nr:hypothetical protein CBR_g31828 [Chara braunii]|eukprot:GBG81152.1 hypothetical protein CBR_g31828 [Chara braunii]